MSVSGLVPSHACIGHECKKGSQCIPSPYGNSYSCRCQTGWQGRYCEKGDSSLNIIVYYRLRIHIYYKISLLYFFSRHSFYHCNVYIYIYMCVFN